MARKPRPWFRKRRGWFVTLENKQIPLGVVNPAGEPEAWDALRKLLGEVVREQLPGTDRPRKSGTVRTLIRQFLDEKKPLIEPGTARSYGQHLGWLDREFGHADPARLSGEEVARRAAGVESWGDTHRSNVLATAGLFLRWCGLETTIPRPPKASRGAEAVITDETYRLCLDATRGDFRQLLRFLWLVGCRPGEATGLLLDDVQWDAGTVRLKRHKASRKGKQRILFLGSAALEVLKEQRGKHTSGLAFRGQGGKRLTLRAMAGRFLTLSATIGRSVTSYAFRHTWATRALLAGIPDVEVAAMMGHASTAMIHKHYSHVSAASKKLRENADRLAG